MRFYSFFLIWLLAFLCPVSSHAWESYIVNNMPVYVQKVDTGNIIVVSKYGKNDSRNFSIRLYGIGLPVHNQPFAAEAAQKLRELLPPGAKIDISTVNRDDEGIISALIQRNDRSVNNLLIDEGLAWVNRSECKAFFCRRWHIQEHIAVKDRRGVWSLNMSSPPWQWGDN